jgi:hypothetical protein
MITLDRSKKQGSGTFARSTDEVGATWQPSGDEEGAASAFLRQIGGSPRTARRGPRESAASLLCLEAINCASWLFRITTNFDK